MQFRESAHTVPDLATALTETAQNSASAGDMTEIKEGNGTMEQIQR